MANKEKFWPMLVEALGNAPELLAPRFADFKGRTANRDELTTLLDTHFMKEPTKYWLEKLEGRVPVAPINDIAQALKNPFVREQGRVTCVEHPQGPLSVVAPAIEIDGQILSQTRAPACGQDTDELLSQLGYAPAKIAELRKNGAIA